MSTSSISFQNNPIQILLLGEPEFSMNHEGNRSKVCAPCGRKLTGKCKPVTAADILNIQQSLYSDYSVEPGFSNHVTQQGKLLSNVYNLDYEFCSM